MGIGTSRRVVGLAWWEVVGQNLVEEEGKIVTQIPGLAVEPLVLFCGGSFSGVTGGGPLLAATAGYICCGSWWFVFHGAMMERSTVGWNPKVSSTLFRNACLLMSGTHGTISAPVMT